MWHLGAKYLRSFISFLFREFLSFHLWHMCQSRPNFGKKSLFSGKRRHWKRDITFGHWAPILATSASVSAVVFSSSAGDSRKHRFIASCPVSTTSSYPESIAREEDTGHSRPQWQAGTFSAKETKNTVLNTALHK